MKVVFIFPDGREAKHIMPDDLSEAILLGETINIKISDKETKFQINAVNRYAEVNVDSVTTVFLKEI